MNNHPNNDTVWLVESPVAQVAGESVAYVINFPFATTLASPAVTVYKGTTDVTSTVMPAGSHAVSGNSVTLKPLTALTGGNTYVVVVEVVVDGGNTERRKFEVKCQKAADKQ